VLGSGVTGQRIRSNSNVPDATGAVLGWLDEVNVEPLAEKWVPGASEVERRRLAALGGVVRELVAGRSGDWGAEPNLAQWWEQAPGPPRDVVLAARRLIAERGDVGLGDLYAALVSASSRRHLGTFFTPPSEVSWMVERWCATQPDPRAVIDVGAGVGIFTAAAARRWPRSQVWAVDVNPVTLGLLVARIAGAIPVVSPQSKEAGVRLVLGDYVAWAEQNWSRLSNGRLVLGNPPYTRRQLLPVEDRARLGAAAGGLCGSRASLSALITAVSLRLLGPGDGLCLLLPAQWLEAQYAVALRRRLWTLKHRRVELRLFDAALFDDVLVDAVALLIGTQRDEEQPLVVATGDRDSQTIDRKGDSPAVWRGLFGDLPRRQSTQPGLDQVCLGDLAVVRRGTATGDNHFFVLSEAGRRRWRLPSSVLMPTVRRLRDFPTVVDQAALDDLDDRVRRWILVADESARRTSLRLADYIAHGEAHGVGERELCRRRSDWFDLNKELFVPNVIIGPMSQGVFRFVDNRACAVITNNLYGIRWHADVAENVRTAVVEWLRSVPGQQALTAMARNQGGGLKKIEPGALCKLVIPTRLVGAGSYSRRLFGYDFAD
jgi:adenine-specific DNA-methyltransferase